MSKDNKKKEEGSTFLIGIALAGLFIYKLNETAPHILWFLLLIPTVIAISLATGKRLDYRLNWVIPTITLGLILTFWGVPFSHTPLWNASNAFKNSEVGVPYFVKIDRIKDDLKYAKEDVKDDLETIRDKKSTILDYPGEAWAEKDLAEARESYYGSVKARDVLIVNYNKANLRKVNPFKFQKLVKKNTKEAFSEFNSVMLLSLLVLIGLYIAFFALGRFRSRRTDKNGSFAKIGIVLIRPIELLLNAVWKIKIPEYENVFLFGNGRSGFLTDKNLGLHTQVVGGSGVGKTNFLQTFMADRVKKGRGLIFLDFKADFEVLEWLQGVCLLNERRDFKVFTLSDSDLSVPYNPIEYGSATEISSQLMNSFNWSEEYYKNYAENALLMTLNLLCYLRDTEGEKFHLGHVLKLLTDPVYRRELLPLASGFKYQQEISSLFQELDSDKNAEKLSGLVIQIKKILFSNAGDVFTTNVERYEPLKFRDAIKNGEVVYLFMNSMGLKEVATSVGRMILQDLMKEVGHIYDSRIKLETSVSVVIDEFASFATPDFINFLDKARGAEVELMLAHQSMADLKEVSDNFGTRIFENTASKVIFNTLSSDDAEIFASMMGTREEIEDTEQIDKSTFFGSEETGMGSRRTVEKFNIHPNTFKNLGQGEAVVMTSKVDQHFGVTKINRVESVDSGPMNWEMLNNRIKNLDRYITLESTDNEKSKMTDGFYASQAKQKSNRLQSDGLKGI
ncbi:MAG: TraM recognition domain-containing protein [Bacteriovoracaceae bacterium]|jgi:hypothetical protein|nr:TraM recognition domain-containing protein [Bacteriovoracaceae bacterium]